MSFYWFFQKADGMGHWQQICLHKNRRYIPWKFFVMLVFSTYHAVGVASRSYIKRGQMIRSFLCINFHFCKNLKFLNNTNLPRYLEKNPRGKFFPKQQLISTQGLVTDWTNFYLQPLLSFLHTLVVRNVTRLVCKMWKRI